MNKRYKGSIIAVDIATKTGWAIYNNGKIIKSGTWRFSIIGREKELYSKLKRTIEQYGVIQIVAEDVYKGQKSAYSVLYRLRNVVKKVAATFQLPQIVYISPIKVQRYMWGRRYGKDYNGTEKQEMIGSVKRLGYQLENDKADDEADAIGILITYLHNNGIPVKHPK